MTAPSEEITRTLSSLLSQAIENNSNWKMNPELQVTAFSIIPGAKIVKDWMGHFSQPVHYTVEGKQIVSDVTARRKKDLPRNVGYMQKLVDRGVVRVQLNSSGRIGTILYPLV